MEVIFTSITRAFSLSPGMTEVKLGVSYGEGKDNKYILLPELRLRINQVDGAVSGMQRVEYLCGRDRKQGTIKRDRDRQESF